MGIKIPNKLLPNVFIIPVCLSMFRFVASFPWKAWLSFMMWWLTEAFVNVDVPLLVFIGEKHICNK